MSFRLYNYVRCLPCIQGSTGPTGPNGTIFKTQAYSVETNMTGIVGSATGTLIDVGDVDDGNFEIQLPFPVTFLNQIYNTVYIGSNSYLTFGSGSDVFFNIDGFNPPMPGLLINSNDNSMQKYYNYLNENGDKFIIRYEGTLNKYGLPTPPPSIPDGPIIIPPPALEWIWEVTFYKDSSRIDIAWIPPYVENVNGVDGVFKISSGNGTVQNLPKTEHGVILIPQNITYDNVRIEGDGITIIFNNDIRTTQTNTVANLNIQPLKNITVDTFGGTTKLGSNNIMTIKNNRDLTIETTVNETKCADISFTSINNNITFTVDETHNINIARPKFAILNNTLGNPNTLYIDEDKFIKIYEE